MLFRGRVNRSNIKNFLLVSVREPLIGERKGSQDNQYNSSQAHRFHDHCTRLNRTSSARNQINYEYCQSHQQQDMNESPKSVRSDHPEEPKHAQDNQNSPKHCHSYLTRKPVSGALVSHLKIALSFLR